MPVGKYRRQRAVRQAGLRGVLAFLTANFQVATREQRVGWFGTADPDEFKRNIGALFTQVQQNDLAARLRLDEIVRRIQAHVAKLERQSRQPEEE